MEKPKLELPRFITDSIKTNKTSLGLHPSFPSGHEDSFLEKLLLNRYEEIVRNVAKIHNLESNKKDYLIDRLNSDLHECRLIEKSIKPELEKICIDCLSIIFDLNESIINIDCKLVDKVKVDIKPNIEPLPLEDCYFESIDEIDSLEKEVYKRRMINALIQGGSVRLLKEYKIVVDKLYDLNQRLPELYYNIMTLNEYLTFTKEVIPSVDGLAGFVSVNFSNGEPKITSQGLIFPVLLFESIKGVFEVVSVIGLPKTSENIEYVIGKSDFLLAENWDRRLGVGLWDLVTKNIKNTDLDLEIFSKLISSDVDTFNKQLKEIFSNTKVGNTIIPNIEAEVSKNKKLREIHNSIKNDEKPSYFTPEELIAEYNIDEAVTTTSVGDYTYDVPAFSDKESLDRKNMIKNGQMEWNIN
jgi:hypothetical protein